MTRVAGNVNPTRVFAEYISGGSLGLIAGSELANRLLGSHVYSSRRHATLQKRERGNKLSMFQIVYKLMLLSFLGGLENDSVCMTPQKFESDLEKKIENRANTLFGTRVGGSRNLDYRK